MPRRPSRRLPLPGRMATISPLAARSRHYAVARSAVTIEAHVGPEILFARAHRERAADRGDGRGGDAARYRRAGVGAVFPFGFRRPPVRSNAARQQRWRGGDFSRLSSSRRRARTRIARTIPTRPRRKSATPFQNGTFWCSATAWPTGSAYGLEDTYTDQPDMGVVRKPARVSGLDPLSPAANRPIGPPPPRASSPRRNPTPSSSCSAS